MVRGYRTFFCTNCYTRFKALDVEWMATAASAPVVCPCCGQKVYACNSYGLVIAEKINKLLKK